MTGMLLAAMTGSAAPTHRQQSLCWKAVMRGLQATLY
jgi:hypothetical protein